MKKLFILLGLVLLALASANALTIDAGLIFETDSANYTVSYDINPTNITLEQDAVSFDKVNISKAGEYPIFPVRMDVQSKVSETQVSKYELNITGSGVDARNIYNDDGYSYRTVVLPQATLNASVYNASYFPFREEFTTKNTSPETHYLNLSNTLLNVTVWDTRANTSVQTFTATVYNSNYDFIEVSSTTSGLVQFNLTQGVSYTVAVDNVSYALESQTIQPLTSAEAINFTVYLTNSLRINIYDIETGDKVTSENVTITFTNSEGSFENVTSTGEFFIHDLTPDNYTIDFDSTTYAKNTYYATVTNRSTQELNAYLISSGTEQVIFTFRDVDAPTNNNLVTGSVLTIERIINGNWTIINVLTSDVTGRIQFNYQDDKHYRFTVNTDGFEDKEFEFNPIIFDSYNVWLTKTAVSEEDQNMNRINIIISPYSYYSNANNTVILKFISPDGEFENYGFTVTWRNNTITQQGINLYGETLTDVLLIEDASFGEQVLLEYHYQLSDGSVHSYSLPYLIDNATIIGTHAANRGNDYDLGLIERTLIVVISVLFAGGAGYLFAGNLGAGLLIQSVLGYLTYIQIISPWLTIPSMILVGIAIAWRSR